MVATPVARRLQFGLDQPGELPALRRVEPGCWARRLARLQRLGPGGVVPPRPLVHRRSRCLEPGHDGQNLLVVDVVPHRLVAPPWSRRCARFVLGAVAQERDELSNISMLLLCRGVVGDHPDCGGSARRAPPRQNSHRAHHSPQGELLLVCHPAAVRAPAPGDPPQASPRRKTLRWLTPGGSGRGRARAGQRRTVKVRIVPRVTPNCSWTAVRRTASRGAMSPATSWAYAV